MKKEAAYQGLFWITLIITVVVIIILLLGVGLVNSGANLSPQQQIELELDGSLCSAETENGCSCHSNVGRCSQIEGAVICWNRVTNPDGSTVCKRTFCSDKGTGCSCTTKVVDPDNCALGDTEIGLLN